MKSRKFQLNKTDLTKILTGAGIAGVGASLAFLVETIPFIDFGGYSPFVVALFSILANSVRKYLAGK